MFDFKGIYAYAHAWFIEAKYNVNEEKYVEKVKGNKKDIDDDEYSLGTQAINKAGGDRQRAY